MRKHLRENQEVSGLPVIKKSIKQKVKSTQQIPLHCSCSLPNISGMNAQNTKFVSNFDEIPKLMKLLQMPAFVI